MTITEKTSLGDIRNAMEQQLRLLRIPASELPEIPAGTVVMTVADCDAAIVRVEEDMATQRERNKFLLVRECQNLIGELQKARREFEAAEKRKKSKVKAEVEPATSRK